MKDQDPSLLERVVYVSPYYDPKLHSGSNNRFNEICSRLSKDFGDRFTLIVAKGKVPEWWDGKNLIEVDYRFTHLSKFTAARQIGQALDRLPPSTVIVESIPIPLHALARHRHFQVAYDFRYFHQASKGLAYRLLFSEYLKYEWRHSQHMVTCSDFSIEELEHFVGYPRERVLKSFFGINERILDVSHLPADKKEFDVIYVAHFDKHKNHAALIDALALLDPNLKVRFVGSDCGLRSSLMERAKGCGLTNVTFGTVRDDRDLWEIYTKTRLFVSTSLYEGFGMPTIEALALGLPVVISDIKVFHEVGGDLATYFDPRDPKDIAEKIKIALADPTAPDQVKIRAHLEPYLWENIYKKFVSDLKIVS